MQAASAISPEFAFELRRATEAAAAAAYDAIRRGDRQAAGKSALNAMRGSLAELDFEAVSVLGPAADGDAQQFSRGELLGRKGAGFKADLAADPVEGTSYLAQGMTNALAALAVAPRGTLLDPGPAFYMEKFVACAPARGHINPAWPTAQKLEELARILGKPVPQLTVYVLEKPRHRALVEEITAAGAHVALYPAGDVAGAVMAAIPESGVDCLMGIGGVPEGIISAVAVRALGGEFLGRFAPQLQTEAAAVHAAGLDTNVWIERDRIVRSGDVFFCGTGIASGLMLEGVSRNHSYYRLQTMMIVGATGEREILTSYQPIHHLSAYKAARDVA